MDSLEHRLISRILAKRAGAADYPERARKVLVDTLVVMLRGAREPEIQRLSIALAVPNGTASLFSDVGVLRSTPERAAFANAAGGTFLELDEGVRPTGHPGIHVVPALLATVEGGSPARTMGEVMWSLTVGYEVTARLARTVMFSEPVHPHGHIGSVGVAAALSHLGEGSSETIAASMAMAASLPLRTHWRPCFTGDTVRNAFTGVGAAIGLWAATLADAGFTAEPGAIQTVLAPALGQGIHLEELLDEASPWAIEGGYHKFYAGCALTHPSTEAALAVREAPEWGSDTVVSRVRVEVPARFMRTAGLPNGTRLSAKFSTPWAVAAALVTGLSDERVYQEPMLSDRKIWDMARQVRVEPTADLTARFPVQAGSRIHVVLASGKLISATCDEPAGGPTRVASWDQLYSKSHALVPEVDERVWSRMKDFEDKDSGAEWWRRVVHALRARG